MSAQHTPSPWLIAGGEEKTFVYALNEQGYNRFSAHVQCGHVAPMERTSLAELEANARLIAAAPELLEALTDVLDSLGAITKKHELYNWMTEEAAAKVYAAIAKATGSSA